MAGQLHDMQGQHSNTSRNITLQQHKRQRTPRLYEATPEASDPETTTSKPHSSQEARVTKSSPTTLFSGATLFRTRKVLFEPGYQQRRIRAFDECFPALPITPSLSLNLVTPLLGPNSSWKMRTYGRGGQSTSLLHRNGTRSH